MMILYGIIIYIMARVMLRRTLIGKSIIMLYRTAREICRIAYYTTLWAYRKTEKVGKAMKVKYQNEKKVKAKPIQDKQDKVVNLKDYSGKTK